MTVIEQLKHNPNFMIKNNIPRQTDLYTNEQMQTSDVFGFKWHKTDTFESEAMQKASQSWLIERYALPSIKLEEIIQGKKILDAGCGAGHSAVLLFGDLLNHCDYLGVDISNAVEVAAQRFAERNLKGEFLQASLMNLPDEIGNFDIIFSEGVLHHTDSTEKAVKYLAKKLNPKGFFMFYVYKQKGAVREFTDDYIREKIALLDHQEAWNALIPISKLGKTLGDLNVEIEIEESIDLLDIPAGKINLQRFFYWHIMKCFYRPDFSLDEMNHINFDWFMPKNAYRQTPEQVKNWVEACGLKIIKMGVEEAGITVIAQKA